MELEPVVSQLCVEQEHTRVELEPTQAGRQSLYMMQVVTCLHANKTLCCLHATECILACSTLYCCMQQRTLFCMQYSFGLHACMHGLHFDPDAKV